MHSLFRKIRIHWRIYKRRRELGRPLSETELHVVLADVLDETNLIFRAVGAVAIVWAEAELILDYTNGILILQDHIKNPKLPRTSLDAKFRLFKNGFDRTPELALLRETAFRIAAELDRLRFIRHDIVHGVAIERMPVTVRKLIRPKIVGKDITEEYKTYTIPEMTKAATDILAAKNELFALFREMLRILHPDQAKQSFG